MKMKILVATQSKGGLEDLVSLVFGRAPTFTIVEVEKEKIKKTEVHTNTAARGFRGVGIQAAQFAANKGVDIIIAGNIGPYASSVLAQIGIDVVTGFVGMKVKDAVQSYLKGVTPAAFPTIPSPQTFQPLMQPSIPKPTKIDIEFEKKILELRKKMIEEQIKYLDKKNKELKK